MTPLRQHTVNDMTVRGVAVNTRKSYLNSVSGLACHHGRGPDRISAREVRDYRIFLHQERGLTWQSRNRARHGIRFFYRITLGLPEPRFYLPGARTPSTLTELLNHDELSRDENGMKLPSNSPVANEVVLETETQDFPPTANSPAEG